MACDKFDDDLILETRKRHEVEERERRRCTPEEVSTHRVSEQCATCVWVGYRDCVWRTRAAEKTRENAESPRTAHTATAAMPCAYTRDKKSCGLSPHSLSLPRTLKRLVVREAARRAGARARGASGRVRGWRGVLEWNRLARALYALRLYPR